jgi:hypothetical protein
MANRKDLQGEMQVPDPEDEKESDTDFLIDIYDDSLIVCFV